MTELIGRLNDALEGRYSIERELGEGGMATVYLADDLRHERKVAIKVLKPELAAVIGADRFLTEIKTTANLQHPHILPLFDSGEADGFLFYVMPYVEGESLRDRLDREGQLPVADAVEIATQVAAALEAAHQDGVVHRDIKPANVLLRGGNALVTDFGIGLAVSAAGGERLTQTGLSLGTPAYMSPEQASGDSRLDGRTDLYSLAATLYEMLAGRPPFVASTTPATLALVLTETPARVSTHRDSTPPNVDAAVHRALAKLPADRFSDATGFARALADPTFGEGGEAGAATSEGPWNRLALATTGLSLLLAGALAVTLLGRSDPDPTVTRFVVPPPEGVIRYNRCCGNSLALSPDGEWLVFKGFGAGEGQSPLYRRRRSDESLEAIPGTHDGGMPFFSPDGAWLGFSSGNRLWKVPMGGGPRVPITDSLSSNPENWGAAWTEDDRVVFGMRDSLWTIPSDGGTPRHVPNTGGLGYALPWALPGEEALVIARGAEAEEPEIVVVDLETGAAETVGLGTRAVYASGHVLISRIDGSLQARRFDPSRRRPSGEVVTIEDRIRLARPGFTGEFALSGEGDLAFQPGEDPFFESLAIVGSGTPVRIADPTQQTVEEPAFSPDGRRIAFDFGSTVSDIWILDRQLGTREKFTVDGESSGAVWTRDGTRVTFETARDGFPQVYWKASDGGGPAERLFVTDHATYPGSWFPGDRTLAFMALRESYDIGTFTRGDSSPRWILASEFNEIQPQVSPDGRWLAYASDRTGVHEVYVQPSEGQGRVTQVSSGGGSAPRWAPDRDILYYVANPLAESLRTDGTLMAASYEIESGFEITGREAVLGGVADLNVNNVNWDIDPDGDQFILVDPGSEAGGTRGIPVTVWVVGWPKLLTDAGGS